MLSAIILSAGLSTAVAAQVGRRHPYGIYPSPSITASLNSTSSAVLSSGYSISASLTNTTSDKSIPTNTATPTFNLTTSAIFLTSVISGPLLSWTTKSNGTFVLDSSSTLTASTTSASATDTTATSTTSASATSMTATSTSVGLPRTTCVSIKIGDVTARGLCGCDYNIHTCLERLSNLSEWSNSQTTEWFNGCMGACDLEPNCFSFTWQTSNGVCRMFGGMLDGGAGVISDADFISGEVVKGSCTGSCSG